MKLKHLAASLAFATANLAHAVPVTLLSYGQVGASTTTITAVDNGAGQTNIQTTTPLEAVTISGIAANTGGFVTPFTGFLTLNASSTVAPTTTLGTTFNQLYTGSFQIFANAGGTGNILSATFSDALVSGLLGGTALTLAASDLGSNLLSFTSDYFATLSTPEAASFAFSAVDPIVAISGDNSLSSFTASFAFSAVDPIVAISGDNSLSSFTASFAGTDSATLAALPEPGSLLLFGLGLGALGFTMRRNKQI